MSLVDVVLSRRSIRRYEQREVPKDVLDRILEAGRQAPSAMNRQPWHFVVLTDYEVKKKLSRGLFNRHIIAAWAMGVGTCWIGDFKEDQVKQLLNIPDKWKVVALVSFGYPAEKPKAKRRKPLEKIVGFNTF